MGIYPYCASLFMLFSSFGLNAQPASFVLHADTLQEQQEILLGNAGWSFYSGELPAGSTFDPEAPGWQQIPTTQFGKANLAPGWQGFGWFRAVIKVDEGLVGKKLGLRINHDGASELFFDGKPIGGYGTVGHSAGQMKAVRAPKALIPLWFTDTLPHTIQVHYSNFFGVYSDFVGYQIYVGEYDKLSRLFARSTLRFNFVLMCAGAQIVLGLLHLFLFFSFRPQKLNLYFASFALLMGLKGIFVYFFYETNDPSIQYWADFLCSMSKVSVMWFGCYLLYALGFANIPRWRLGLLTGVSLFHVLKYIAEFWMIPQQNWDYFLPAYLLFTADALWIAYQASRKQKKGLWLITLAMAVTVLLHLFAWVDVFLWWSSQLNSMRVLVMEAGELIFPLCLSLYLASRVRYTNHTLIAKLEEVERLSAQSLNQEAEKRELIASEARRLEETVQQRTAELQRQTARLQEMDAMRSRFFTNITHEFKTPLTLIINPAQELLLTPQSVNLEHHANLILQNAQRLLQLINQLMDLSKLENGLMEMVEAPLDLVELIRGQLNSQRYMALQKNIDIQFSTAWETRWILGDCDKLQKIIGNVLSNAVKFTDHGSVIVRLQADNSGTANDYLLQIYDTGRGIPAEKQPYIFDRFYQVDPSDTRFAEGTGIGLALVKELVELMKGQISVESIVGIYTEISIRLSLQPGQGTAEIPLVLPVAPIRASVPLLNRHKKIPQQEVPLILIIEDHNELRDFISQSLSDHYRTICAKDGHEGICLGFEQIPNLIITDLMMPGMDGYQVCSTFKEDVKTSHIPVLILTAKADINSRIQGMQTGADAYLGKPFDQRELFAVIDNLLTIRRQLREHYSQAFLQFANDETLPSMEKAFIGSVKHVIECHLEEEGYGTEQLARDMRLSRAQLHRKLKDLTGQSPGELIRIVRLQQAYALLQGRIAPVSQVGYMVGFATPASFSASFSQHFGFPPSKVPQN